MLAFFQIPQCFSVSIVGPSDKDSPWFTGPLLTPSARVISKGDANLEPYLYYFISTARYDNHWKAITHPTFNRIIMQLNAKIGITEKIDLTLIPQSHRCFSQGRRGASFGDLPFGFNYQLYEGKPEDWLTYVKLSVIETFPTGKFDKLNPKLKFTDTSGQGNYLTNIGLTFSSLVKLTNHRFFSYRWNITASVGAPAKVKGLSIYGGNALTRAKVNPGTSYFFLAGAEYTLIKEISLACDFEARYSPRKRFKGFSALPLSGPEVIQFALAPAIEYNWNSEMGIIIGTWFSLAAKNSDRFISTVAAFNYSY